ncbi:MAG: substrate-binding domain-containing protein [Lentisphaeria bacterium]|nr:substrate-binding domain-containing protein [Lentisphaeria bacterium]
MSEKSNQIQRVNTFISIMQSEIRRGNYSPGEKLPSERGLCVKYGFSRPTIHKNLDEMIKEGLLERRGRSVFVSSEAWQHLEASNSSGRVVLLTNEDGYVNVIYNSIMESIISRLSDLFTLKLIVTKGQDFSLKDRILEDDIVIVFGLFLADGQFKAISQRCRNIFAVNFKSRYGNWIMPDNYQAGRMMAECLYSHGHRKIASVLQTADYTEFEERFLGAQDYLAERDIHLQRMWIPCQTYFYDVSELHFYKYILGQEATALLCLRRSMSMQLYDIARSHGISIPKDFSIVSFDDTYGCDLLEPPLTSCRYPTAVIAEKLIMAVPRAFKQERGKKFLQEKIVPLLVERESVATLSST